MEPYYRRDLALIHHRAFGLLADSCAPGVLRLLAAKRGEVIVELGCGSGLLTKHLVAAGHRVVATDLSPAMLDLARETVPEADIRCIGLPDDPLPECDAVVSVGHVLNYLPDEASIERAVSLIARSLRPGGALALDLCDLEWGTARRNVPPFSAQGEGWAIIVEFSTPAPDRFVRLITTFVRREDGAWRRDEERHDNVLVDASRIAGLFRRHGVQAHVASSFGGERLPAGMRTVIGKKEDVL